MAILLKTFLDSFIGQNDNWQLQLLKNWPTIVGTIKTKVQLLKIYDDMLIIGVFDSCWMQELYLLTPILLSMINEKLDKPRIQKLRFKTIVPSQQKKKSLITQTVRAKRAIVLQPKEIAMLETIKDEQLRVVLKDYLVRCYQEK